MRKLWRELTYIWEGLKELLEIPNPGDQTPMGWFVSKLVMTLLLSAIILMNFKEFLTSWLESRKVMLKECSVCKEGYDAELVDYELKQYFCPQCIGSIGSQGLSLIEKFRQWAMKQVDKNGRPISNSDILGIILSSYYAIKNKAGRLTLFDALDKYTQNNVSDALTLSELLEELTMIQNDKA